jgi:DNA-binding IclR family transcriptional regulator
MFAEGPDGFTGGLSAANYQTITDASSATTTRDLAELVRLGALRKEGELKRTRYRLNLAEYGGERLPAALQSPRRLLEE